MIKTLRQVVFFSQFLLISFLGQAQQVSQKAPVLVNKSKLEKISVEQNLKYNENRERALMLAKKHNWIISDTKPDGTTISLQGLTESGRPIYYITHNNETSAITTGTNKLWVDGASGLNLNGSSPQMAGKLGIWDGGAVRATHRELTGRIINRDGATSLNDHATHVAGTMIARGLNSMTKGMANGAVNLQAWNYNNDGSEIANAASSLLVSNHSYGNLAGWRLIGSNWYWYGELSVSDKEDVYYGYYGNTAQLWDNIAFNSPYYLMVKAAGNSRNSGEPAIGQPYYRYNPNIGNWELVSTGRTADMKSYDSYDVIPDHSVAKNILTVGAIHGLANGYTQPSDAVIFGNSSWGPTDDGRIKPDLVGSGVRVLSSFASNDEAYNYSTGTSMATPNVSGSLILLQEHYSNRNNGQFMLAATLKGLAIHTTNEAGNNPGPDYVYGWGVLNAEQAAQVITNRLKTHQLSENSLFQGQTYTQTVKASGSEPLRVTISWTDPAGTVLAMTPSTLNNRTPRLVNDLDVRITAGSQTHLPWILDPANPSAPASTGNNIRDNVEQILIPNPVPGQTYTITVSHKGTLRNNAQAYSLIVSGLQGIQYCASGATNTTGARIESVNVGQVNNSSASTCNAYTDFTALSANVEVGQLLPISVKVGTCDAPADKVVKIFADWNSDGDFDDADEWAATSAVLPGTEYFNTNIQVPNLVQVGNSTRLRIVLVQTTSAEMISACGAYEKGETEDYTLNFVTPTNDVGITAINIPTNNNFMAHADQGVTVTIKNFGSVSQNNIPVSVSIKNNGLIVNTLSGIYSGTLASGQEKSFTLPGSFNAQPSTTYNLSASTALNTDNITGNNTFGATVTTQALIEAPIAAATSCNNSTANLKGSGNGTVFWYDAPTGGNLVAAGNNTSTSILPANKTYYAVLNQFNGTTATLQNNTAGTFASSTQDTVYFDAAVPFILDRVTINAGTAGTMTVSLYNAANALIGSSQLAVSPGIAQYTVNLSVPAAGNKYRLLVSNFGQGATANRNNASGTLQFPYTLPNVLTVSRASTGSLFVYDWKVKAAGTPSARIAVKLNGTLTTSANNLCASNNSGTITFNNPGTITRWESSADGLTWTSIAYTQNNYAFSNLAATTYFRTIFNDGNCTNIATDPIVIAVNPAPVAMVTASGSTKICQGNTLTLTASTGTYYLWSTGQTTKQITVSQPGNYSVQVTNANGCTATSAAVTVSYCLTTWTGNTDTDWNNSTNWTNGVPDAEMDVMIPANLTHYPVINTGQANSKNLTNQGSLSLNGGVINIAENFTNSGTLNQTNNALLQFSGNVNHTITGSLFQNLRIGGTGNKTLSSDVTITGNLTITEGTVSTGPYKVILDGTATLTETASNYIIGTVQASRSFKSVSTQNFGNMGISLTTTASPSPTIQVTRVTGVTAPGNIRSVKRYFDVAVTSGKTSGLNATMEFTYLPGELNGLLKDNLALYRSTDNGTTWTVQENSVTTLNESENKITLAGISAFSVWTASDRNPTIVLPVTVASFNAAKKQNETLLTWETATEKNAYGMEVEVSTDAKNYRKLGFVAATGINSNTRQAYQFTDTEFNKKGTRYYRLKQIDLNGDVAYFGPKAVNFDDNFSAAVTVYPNPSQGTFALLANANQTEQMQVEVINMAGKTVYCQKQLISKGENKVMVNLPAGTPAGVYVILATYNNTTSRIKMVVE